MSNIKITSYIEIKETIPELKIIQGDKGFVWRIDYFESKKYLYINLINGKTAAMVCEDHCNLLPYP